MLKAGIDGLFFGKSFQIFSARGQMHRQRQQRLLFIFHLGGGVSKPLCAPLDTFRQRLNFRGAGFQLLQFFGGRGD